MDNIPELKLGHTAFDNNPLDQYRFDQSIKEILALDHTSPEYEGFFSRIWNAILNTFKSVVNQYTALLQAWYVFLDQNWLRYCNEYLKILNTNPPSNEQFNGAILLRSTQMEAKQYLTCLKAAANLIKNTEKALLSNDRAALSPEITNVVRYLETNKCKINTSKPSESKAATRFAYGSVGRMGTSGYGGDFLMYSGKLRGILAEYGEVYKILSNVDDYVKAIERVQIEIEKRIRQSENANDRQRDELFNQINNIRTRITAMRAIQKVTIDFFNTTLATVAVVPLGNLGLIAGYEDTLWSKLFSTDND